MPELPEIELYLHALRPRIQGEVLQSIRIRSPSLLRSYDPPVSALEGRRVLGLERLGKRVVWVMEDDLFAVFHLMVMGRFKWRSSGTAIPKKGAHAAFDFPQGTLLLTEAGTKTKASLHLVRGRAALEDHDPGGLEVLSADLPSFRERFDPTAPVVGYVHILVRPEDDEVQRQPELAGIGAVLTDLADG